MDFSFSDRPNDDRIKETLSGVENASDPELTTLFLDVQWTYREMQKAYDHLLEQYQLSESKFILLMFLERADKHELQPSELATKLGATRATVSKLLVGMERSRFIQKVPTATDKRMVLIRLTDTGQHVLNDFLPSNFQAVDTIFSTFSKADQQALTSLLAKVKQGTKQLNQEIKEN